MKLSRPRGLLARGGLALLLLILLLLLQLVPFGRDHANPPVSADAPWPDPRARALALTACYDCHSNQTRWPLYSRVAPLSWLLANDVRNGRDKLNFSEWDRGQDARDAADAVLDGSMPPARYTPIHPEARLSDDQRRVLAEALRAMDRRGGDGGGRGRGGGGDGGERGGGGG